MVVAAAAKSMELALLVEHVVADADVARAHVDADAAPQLPHADVDVDVDVALQLPHADADVDVAPQLPHADAAHVVAGPAMLAPVKCFVPCTLRSFFGFSQSFSRQVLHFHSLTSCCY